MRNWIILLALYSSAGLASVPAIVPPARSPVTPAFPIWQIERNHQTSYIIGTPPFDVDPRALPRVYGRLIRSKPKFLTDLGENIQDIEFVQNVLGSSEKEEFVCEKLSRDQMKFVRGIFRRWILTKKPVWKQILIPGYAGFLAEGAAFACGVVPPAIVASAVISASTGFGLGPGPSDEDVLLKIAKDEHREVVPMPAQVDYPFFVKSVEIQQLKDLIDYIQREMKYGRPINLISAYEKLFESAEANTIFELGERLHKSLEKTVATMTDAHRKGGAVVSINLMHLSDPAARADFFNRLVERGFKIKAFDINVFDITTAGGAPRPCSTTLIGD